MNQSSPQKSNRPSWSGQFAFIIAAAASAIGLGNIWRFPYLAAQYGGGIFLLIYVLMTVTLGFTLMTTEVAIGRRTKLSAMKAFSSERKSWGLLGWIVTLVPVVIVPYYCVIGGWITKYILAYVFDQKMEAVVDGATTMVSVSQGDFFTAFITHPWQPVAFGSFFILFSMWLIFSGVKNGIER